MVPVKISQFIVAAGIAAVSFVGSPVVPTRRQLPAHRRFRASMEMACSRWHSTTRPATPPLSSSSPIRNPRRLGGRARARRLGNCHRQWPRRWRSRRARAVQRQRRQRQLVDRLRSRLVPVGCAHDVTDDSGVQHQACVASAQPSPASGARRPRWRSLLDPTPTARSQLPQTGTGTGGLIIAALLVGTGSIASLLSRRKT